MLDSYRRRAAADVIRGTDEGAGAGFDPLFSMQRGRNETNGWVRPVDFAAVPA
jgi:hypothetical protein